MEKYGFTNNRQEINKKEEDGEIHKNWRNKLENLHKLLIYRSR